MSLLDTRYGEYYIRNMFCFSQNTNFTTKMTLLMRHFLKFIITNKNLMTKRISTKEFKFGVSLVFENSIIYEFPVL